jgi:hypothetical protein
MHDSGTPSGTSSGPVRGTVKLPADLMIKEETLDVRHRRGVAVHERTACRAGPLADDEQLISMLVNRARSDGLQLTGEGGLLQQLTKRVLESALEGEITDHLGYDRHDPAGKNSGNSRNGSRTKTVVTDVGPVEVRVPRDVAGTFEPQLVRKRQRRLSGVDEMVLSLSAKGLTHGEISAHLAEVYGQTCPSRPSPPSLTRSWTAWPNGRTGRSIACTRSCSWTRST